MRSTLQELGLNSKEIDVYLALLDMGKASASVIAYRTKIPASTVHYICKKLSEKGLVSFSKDNHSIAYNAESPDKILYLYERQKEELKRKQIKAAKVIAEMKAKMYPEGLLPKMRLCEGAEGLKNIFDDMLKDQKNLFIFLSNAAQDPNAHLHFNPKYSQKRAKNGIHTKAIGLKKPSKTYSKTDQKKHLIQIRCIPENHSPFETEVNIYGDKIAFMSYQKDNLFGILIENHSIARSMKSLFDFYWQVSK